MASARKDHNDDAAKRKASAASPYAEESNKVASSAPGQATASDIKMSKASATISHNQAQSEQSAQRASSKTESIEAAAISKAAASDLRIQAQLKTTESKEKASSMANTRAIERQEKRSSQAAAA